MEQHFQYLAQKLTHNTNLHSFYAYLENHFTQKPRSQKYHEIISFELFSMVNPIGLMKNWGKFSYTV